MGGAWSCCLPCAGGGGGGVRGESISGPTPEITRKASCIQKQHQLQKILLPLVSNQQRAPLGDLDEDIDEDIDDLEDERDPLPKEEDCSREGGTQHRLSPRLHDIEEEDDEEGRHTRER